MVATLILLISPLLTAQEVVAASGSSDLPEGNRVLVDTGEGEVRFAATVQKTEGKPSIDSFGRRFQAFVGSAKADGKPSEFADYFVFLVSADTMDVYRGLAEIGLNTEVNDSRAEGKKRAGQDFLKGDPVALWISWQDEEGNWIERRYEEMVEERIVVDGKEEVRPWKPQFVFHGSGVIHKEGTGCIACPADCPGGLIADNRLPIDELPELKFDTSKAPPEGTKVVVRIRPDYPE